MNNYGYNTYADFDRACGEFLRLLPECETVEAIDGIEKALGLAYLHFERKAPSEQVLAESRLHFLMRRSNERLIAIERAVEAS